MRYRRGARPRWRWAGAVLAPLVIGRSSTGIILAAAVSLAVLTLVLVVAAVTMGAAFAHNAERRRACLQILRILLRLAPWTAEP